MNETNDIQNIAIGLSIFLACGERRIKAEQDMIVCKSVDSVDSDVQVKILECSGWQWDEECWEWVYLLPKSKNS